MATYPADLEFDVVLKDGGTARLRPIKPSDNDALDAMFNRLSAEAVYQRFFRAKTRLTPEELEYFTHVDYEDRMAFVVLHEADIIGVGRYDRTKGEDEAVAEVAFAVDDQHHGRGIGTQLLQHLTYYARTHGITGFSAWVLPDNYPMMRVFRNSGYTLKRHVSEGVYLVEFPTEETPESLEAEGEHEKRAIATSMLPIFYPRTIAVIGASRNPASIGGRLFHNLLGQSFAGAIYPVNPSASAVNGVRAYPFSATQQKGSAGALNVGGAEVRNLPVYIFDPPQALGRRPERDTLSRARAERWDLERLEREYILECLEETHWHQGEAAQILGINRRTLYRKLKKYREDGLLADHQVLQE